MVSTRLSTRDKRVLVSKEISDYFTKLVEPLVTTQRLEEIFDKLEEEIVERSEEKDPLYRIRKYRIWRGNLLFKRKRSKI